MKILHFINETRAAALAEFVITVPFIVVFMFQIVNIGVIIASNLQISAILNTGILYAIRNPSDTSLIQAQLSSASTMNSVTVSATQFCQCSDGSSTSCLSTCSGNTQPSSFVTVTASTSINLVVPDVVFKSPYAIQRSATIRTG